MDAGNDRASLAQRMVDHQGGDGIQSDAAAIGVEAQGDASRQIVPLEAAQSRRVLGALSVAAPGAEPVIEDPGIHSLFERAGGRVRGGDGERDLVVAEDGRERGDQAPRGPDVIRAAVRSEREVAPRAGAAGVGLVERRHDVRERDGLCRRGERAKDGDGERCEGRDRRMGPRRASHRVTSRRPRTLGKAKRGTTSPGRGVPSGRIHATAKPAACAPTTSIS